MTLQPGEVADLIEDFILSTEPQPRELMILRDACLLLRRLAEAEIMVECGEPTFDADFRCEFLSGLSEIIRIGEDQEPEIIHTCEYQGLEVDVGEIAPEPGQPMSDNCEQPLDLVIQSHSLESREVAVLEAARAYAQAWRVWMASGREQADRDRLDVAISRLRTMAASLPCDRAGGNS